MAVEKKLENIPENVLNNEYTQRLMQSYGNLVIDADQSKVLDDLLRHNGLRGQVLAAYAMMKNGFDDRQVPAPKTIGRLIQGLGRQGEAEKAREIYAIGQTIVKGLVSDPESSRSNWFAIEDNMVIALAHLGGLDAAHALRLNMLEQGAAPSADAYGALILHIKDTTDDASNAMTLYQEARQHNVGMNIYLYNNIISKLAKARKADHALELFQRMKADRIQPSSITYGALIGACSRVGDIESAETLFEEMVTQRNFKPRVPPYNTMMQLYTTTKPNREKVLWYYDKMRRAGVNPTAHTYKVMCFVTKLRNLEKLTFFLDVVATRRLWID
jgi:pentatricopeptide repeat protein